MLHNTLSSACHPATKSKVRICQTHAKTQAGQEAATHRHVQHASRESIRQAKHGLKLLHKTCDTVASVSACCELGIFGCMGPPQQKHRPTTACIAVVCQGPTSTASDREKVTQAECYSLIQPFYVRQFNTTPLALRCSVDD